MMWLTPRTTNTYFKKRDANPVIIMNGQSFERVCTIVCVCVCVCAQQYAARAIMIITIAQNLSEAKNCVLSFAFFLLLFLFFFLQSSAALSSQFISVWQMRRCSRRIHQMNLFSMF